MKKIITLLLSGFFMVALITSVWSDSIVSAQDTTGDSQTIQAVVDIKPNTLNLKRNGRFITALIKLPEGNNIADINTDSIKIIKINDSTVDIPAAWALVDEVLTDSLIAKFAFRGVVKDEIETILPADTTFPTAVTFTVSGTLKDITPTFEGTDQVRLINPGKSNKGGKGKGGGGDESEE